MSKKKKRKNHVGLKIILICLMLISIAGSGLMIWQCMTLMRGSTDGSSVLANIVSSFFPESLPDDIIPDSSLAAQTEETEPETTEPPTTLPPEPEHVVSTATIGATGDILMHMPVITTGQQSDGSYNFDYIFQYLRDYSDRVDYAVANLETTLCGTTNGYAYSGYPQFNCPDEIVDALRNAGFDMLLTANNHSYDTGKTGYFRTIETVRSRGLATLGTMLTPEEPKYTIVEINGIRIGMICYTYEGRPESYMANRIYLNGIPMFEGGEDYVNSFLPTNLTPFYEEVAGYLEEMKEQGVEATIMFMHWGVEYTTTPVAHQYEIAQQLCDMGIDVIIGGHPHVVEPIQLLTSSTDPEHKTVCLYSMGNAVSNQRSNVLTSQPSGHTEDGVFFTVTFSKYSDGTVYLEDVDLIPCWVDLRTTSGRYYYILPLDSDTSDVWQTMYGMTDSGYASAQRSYDRTMAIVGEGLTESKNYLAEAKDLREAEYLAEVVALMYPQQQSTVSAEQGTVPAETVPELSDAA